MSAKVLKRILFVYELDAATIDLRNNSFGNIGIKTISKAFKELRCAASLKVGNIDITDDGFIALFQSLESNQCVDYLSLSNTSPNLKNRMTNLAWEALE